MALLRHSSRRIPAPATIAECAAAIAAATGAVAILDSVTPATGLGVVYLLAVLFIAIRHGEAAALCTAVLSVLALNFFFIDPRYRLTIADSENVVALAVFLIAGVVVGRLATTARDRALESERRAQEAAAREREAELLAAAGSAVLAGADIATHLKDVGRGSEPSSASGVRVELSGAPSPAPGELAVRLPTTDRPGWLYVSEGVGWERADLERVAEPLAALVDVALERDRVGRQAADAEAARKADVAKTAVLHAISHDLRSP